MRVDVSQRIAVPRDRVLDALVDKDWYGSIDSGPGLGAPEPLSLSSVDDVVRTSVRWRYAGTLPPTAARLLDAEKMTWVIELRVDRATFAGSVHVVPDHYEGLLTFDATIAFDEADGATIERVSGELAVKVPLFSDAIERAIAGGFDQHLAVEAAALERYCG